MTGYEFDQATALMEAAKNAPAAGGAAPAEAPKAAAKVEEKKEEPEMDMGGLFGDDDEYWANWVNVSSTKINI